MHEIHDSNPDVDLAKGRLTEEQFRLIVEAAPNGIIVVNEGGEIQLVNIQIEKMFGYRRDELIGSKVELLVPERFRSGHPAFRASFMVHPEVRPMGAGRDLFGLRKDGTEFPIEIGLNPIDTERGMLVLSTIVDITKRKRAEERFRLVVESAPNGIIMVDQQGIILMVNQQIERMFNYQREELVGKAVEMLVPERMRERHPQYRRDFISHPQARPMGAGRDLFGLRQDGSEFPIEIGLNPIQTEEGVLVLSTIVDITERKQIERERTELLERESQARQQAEEASRLKDEFLATISHELRTPLTSMLGWVRLLLSGRLDEETSLRALETIERNVKSQAQLIEDLLDISRITTGKLRLDVRPVNLTSVINAVVESVVPAADAKGIRVQTILDSQAGPLNGDYERLQQIVWNLLSNAIKFTPRGGKIQVRLERINSHIELIVSDTGKGIRPEFLPYVFDQFTQADSSTTRTHGGLGMGLAIVKRLSELHGGSVSAYSEGEEKGSTFIVKLPILVTSRGLDDPQRIYSKTSGKVGFDCPREISGLRVLAVDDEPDTCIILRTIFEQCGAYVKTAQSVREAIAIIDEWRPDIVVSDIGMPGEDGYDLIRLIRMRSQEEGGKIPAVALTAFARIEDRMKALSAGYQMHVAKPVEPVELLTIVASLTGVIGQR